jgi:hypothetical protein
MNHHTQIGEHPNSAFTRVNQRDISQNNPLTNQQLANEDLPEVISMKLSARQIAFREIKKLFYNTKKGVQPTK